MKNKILVGLALLVASIGGVHNPLNGMATNKQEQITINGADYTLATETEQDKHARIGSIVGGTVIRTLRSEHVGRIEYGIRIMRIGAKAKKIGYIRYLRTHAEFRHQGIAEKLALEAKKFFDEHDVTSIEFMATPLESVYRTEAADMKRLVDYYLRLGKKYGVSMSHKIGRGGTRMSCTIPDQSAPVQPRLSMPHSRPMIPSRL